MPIHIDADLRPLGQAEFGEIAYRVMDHVFHAHRELGRLFEEDVYQVEVASRLLGSRIEVQVDVWFGDFRKPYFLP